MHTYGKIAGAVALIGTLALTGCGSTSTSSATPATPPSSSNATTSTAPSNNMQGMNMSSSSSTSSSSSGTQGASSGGGFTGGATDLPFPPQNPKSTTLLDTSMPGYKIYSTTCVGCHGSDLEGMVGPELRGIGNVTTDAQLDKFITTGKGGMPAGGELSNPAQIQQVADWLAKQTQK